MFFHEYWWIFPLAMIVVCFFFMKRGCMFGHASHDGDKHGSESAKDILDKRYASGKIDKREYEDKKNDLTQNS